MGMQLEDGTGHGMVAKVNGGNRLYVNAITKPTDAQINIDSGNVWSVPFEGLNPTGADDYVVYIKNTGDKVLHITDIRLMSDTAATQVEVQAVSGVASGGTNITPISHTVGSASVVTGTIQSGSDITGLTNDGILFFIQCAVVNTEYHLKTSSRIRIPKGQAIALLVETATANLTGVISIAEEVEDL